MNDDPRGHVRQPADHENRSVVVAVVIEDAAGGPLKQPSTEGARKAPDADDGGDRAAGKHVARERIDVGRPPWWAARGTLPSPHADPKAPAACPGRGGPDREAH